MTGIRLASLHSGIRRASIALIALLGLFAAPASAAFIDDAGDFLPSYTGPKNADLDVLTVDFLLDGDAFVFAATLAGPVSTPGALYVWGVDRGQGTERFTAGTPSIGQGVRFDAVVLLRADGTGQVTNFGGATTVLAASAISIQGASIVARVPTALLPTTGFSPDRYTANLWPRLGAGNNAQISDFAPDASNLLVQVVPEPRTAPMIGLGIVGLMAVGSLRRLGRRPGRRRRVR